MTVPARLQRAYDAEPEFLERLAELTAAESPSSDADAANRAADLLQQRLQENGWSVTRTQAAGVGDQLTARLPGRAEADGTLVLAHYDTVWPVGTLQQMPFRVEQDRVYGPGVLDMKAGIVNAMLAARAARDHGGLRGPTTLLLTSDEELGSDASRALIEAEARDHARVLVVEPGRDDGALKTGRKGVAVMRASFRGIPAHAGNEPERGASALREAARFLLFAEGLTDVGAGTTVNVTVAAGGSAGNVIAETARCELDVRVSSETEGRRVIAALHGYRPNDPRVEVQVHGDLNRPPLAATAANRALEAEAQGHLAALGLHLDGATVGGGSDGNFTSAMNIATLDGLGSVGEGAHARHEQIRLRETLQRLALLEALLSGDTTAVPDQDGS